jgi:hypothetical protein
MKPLLALVLFLAPPAAYTPPKSADPSLVLPAETKIYVPVEVKVDGLSPAAQGRVKISPTPAWRKDLSVGSVLFTGPPGVYHVSVLLIDFDAKKYVEAEADARIVGEVPPGPEPPGPTPPGPGPGPAPIAGMIDAPGFHVLVKYDRDDTTRNASERSILFSESDTSVRQYLKKNCPTLADGLGFRFYPVPAEGVSAPWKAPYERKQGDLPIAVISKDGKGWEGSIKDWTPEKFIAKCEEIRK